VEIALRAWLQKSAICSLALAALVVGGTPARAERAVVVFGSAVRPDGRPSPSLLRRLQTTLGEARRDPGARIVVSGGTAAGRAEGPFMARWLTDRGVRPDRLLVESRARHTGENADLVVPLLGGAGIDRVTLVTERFHMRRARYHLRAALREQGLGRVGVGTCPAPDGLRGARRLRRWFKESAKIVRDASLRCWRRVRRPVRQAPALKAPIRRARPQSAR
jgi:uncharacterized SAM-binding protein YcdF (DUF218 family)